MTARPVIHDTFAIERTYPASPSRVFAAFASKEAKDAWNGDDPSDPSDPPAAGPGAGDDEFDFRIGGHERFGFDYQGISYRYDARYYDIVDDQRIVYSYEMHADGVRISVSVATIEFDRAAAGTALTWTEQGAYLDGFDGPDSPRLRREGTGEMLDALTKSLG